MADSNEIENGEEKRDKNFSDKLKSSHDILSMIKELLDETTAKEIESLGFERNDKVAGVYGDGSTYGAGVEEDEYNVIITGRPRKFNKSKDMDHGPDSGTIEKQIFIGAKRVESQVDFEIKGKVLHLQYRSPESGFFRGIDDNGKSFMVKEKLIIKLSKAKKAIKDLFADAARREVGFLTNTKLGVEDRLDASTTSIVENLEIDMKNLSIKSLLEGTLSFEEEEQDNSSEEFQGLPQGEEPNLDKVKKLNTQKVDGSDKYMLFDEEEASDTSVAKQFSDQHKLQGEELNKAIMDTFGAPNYDALTDAEKNSPEMRKIANSIHTEEEQISEISTTGPAIAGSDGGYKDGANSGAGGYNTNRIAKGEKGTKSKAGKKADVGAPFDIPVNHPIYEEENLRESKKASKFQKTSYSKSQSNKPKVDKDYNIIPEERKINASKPYTQVVTIDPNTHPQGMPFVKPNSKEELEKATNGDKDKLKRIGLEEGASNKTGRLLKRKFISESENKDKGLNKRYIVTEKTSSEYEKDRWNKLSLFSKFETIKESEEMNSVFENLNENENENFFAPKKEIIKESVEVKEVIEEAEVIEETIDVEKPGSMFGITQRFYKKDFLNESKKFILDLNSMVFVSNPNSGK